MTESFWSVCTVYGRTLKFPLRFNTRGTSEVCVPKDARASVSVKKKCSKWVSIPCPADDAKCEEGVTYWVLGLKCWSITQPRVIFVTLGTRPRLVGGTCLFVYSMLLVPPTNCCSWLERDLFHFFYFLPLASPWFFFSVFIYSFLLLSSWKKSCSVGGWRTCYCFCFVLPDASSTGERAGARLAK